MRRITDRAERERRFAAIGRLATEAQGVDLLPAQFGSVAVDGRGYEQTWSDVLRLQRAGIEPQSFAAIQVPVLMLHGDQDPHPGRLTRDRLRQFMPQLEFVELAACGHEPWRERQAREVFLATLRDWLLARAAT
jgi:pimeloyl-ACP methyl ester carboxylesterase